MKRSLVKTSGSVAIGSGHERFSGNPLKFAIAGLAMLGLLSVLVFNSMTASAAGPTVLV